MINLNIYKIIAGYHKGETHQCEGDFLRLKEKELMPVNPFITKDVYEKMTPEHIYVKHFLRFGEERKIGFLIPVKYDAYDAIKEVLEND